MKERNPDKSKAAILLAAETEFADKGFFGARVDKKDANYCFSMMITFSS